ncbi:MAG: hypothetical protein L3K13_05230 [Thermoplasmata archaeon]|nr:hypothetical protein [Thermoplasmata archaeon]
MQSGHGGSALRETVQRNLRWSLPLLLLGTVSVAIGVVLFLQQAHAPPSRYPVWGLAFAIGILALAAGLVSLFYGDFSSDSERGLVQLTAEEMVVPKGEWLELRKRVEVLSQRSHDEPGGWTDAPLSLTFMPVSNPPKRSSRRLGRGAGRPSGGGASERNEFESEPIPEPPPPPPPQLVDSSSSDGPREPKETRPKSASDGS